MYPIILFHGLGDNCESKGIKSIEKAIKILTL